VCFITKFRLYKDMCKYKSDNGGCAYFALKGFGPLCCVRYVDTSEHDRQSEGQQTFCRKRKRK